MSPVDSIACIYEETLELEIDTKFINLKHISAPLEYNALFVKFSAP